MGLFCPNAIVWGDVASWVGALVTAVVAGVAVWTAREAIEVAKIPALEAERAQAAANAALANLIAPAIAQELRRAQDDCVNVGNELTGANGPSYLMWGNLVASLRGLGIRPMKMCETHLDHLDVFGRDRGRELAYAIGRALNLQAELEALRVQAQDAVSAIMDKEDRSRCGSLGREALDVAQRIGACHSLLDEFGGAEIPRQR